MNYRTKEAKRKKEMRNERKEENKKWQLVRERQDIMNLNGTAKGYELRILCSNVEGENDERRRDTLLHCI
jgi:hypothetical protein